MPSFFSFGQPQEPLAEVDDTLPSPSSLTKALNATVNDNAGKSIPFSSVLTGRRTLVTFVRHHHCGMCFEFVRGLSKDPYLSTLSGTKEGPQVIVIGHGGWEGIDKYKERTECAFEMYVDPRKGVYNGLGMTSKLFGGKPPKDHEPVSSQLLRHEL